MIYKWLKLLVSKVNKLIQQWERATRFLDYFFTKNVDSVLETAIWIVSDTFFIFNRSYALFKRASNFSSLFARVSSVFHLRFRECNGRRSHVTRYSGGA